MPINGISSAEQLMNQMVAKQFAAQREEKEAKLETRPRIHVFVLHYERDDVTNQCIEALMPQVWGMDADLFVIDNGSPLMFRTKFAVRVIRNSGNLPLIEAFNGAMKAHAADVYVCVTNDTRAHYGMLPRLVDALSDPKVGIVAPGTNDMGAGILYADRPGEHGRIETTHVDNTVWAFRHDLVERIGWPDCKGHTHRACWASNQDFCYRARQAGFRVMAVRDAYVWHAHNGGEDREAFEAGRGWLIGKWGEEAPKVWA